MAKIYLDVDKLEIVIEQLRNLAADAEKARTDIDDEFKAEGDPISVDDFLTTANKKIENLENRATAIESCKNEIKRLNESGLTGMDDNGVITYEVPDSVAVHSVDDLSSMVQATIDANESQNASPEDLLNLANGSMVDHENDYVYAAVFADTLGPEKMAELAYTLEYMRQQETMNLPEYDPADPDTDYGTRWDRTNQSWLSAQATLSTMFGTATTSPAWKPDHREQYAHDFASLVTEENPSPSAVLGFNYLLTGADRSAVNVIEVNGGARQSGGIYDTNFLLTVARDVQAHEQASGGYPSWRQAQGLGGMNAYPGTTSGSWDPMTGVLTAMGRKPSVALEYLAPATDDYASEKTVEVDDSTMEWLRSRDWDSTSFEAYTAALGGASTLRQPTSETTDERAAWLSEQAVVDLSGRKDGTFSKLWSGVSRRNAGMVLASSIQEVDEAANEAEREGDSSTFNASLPAGWRNSHDNEVRTLLQETLKDDAALRTVSDAAGRYASLRTEAALSDLDSSTTSYGDAYNHIAQKGYANGSLLGYVQGAAEKGRGAEAAELDALNATVLDAFGKGLSFVPGPQTPWISTASEIAKSYALDAARGTLSSHVERVQKESISMQDEVEQRMMAETYDALDHHGYLPDGAYVDKDGNPYADGGYSAWMGRDEDGNLRIDAKALLSNPDSLRQFNGWIQDDPDLSGASSDALRAKDGFDEGVERGRR